MQNGTCSHGHDLAKESLSWFDSVRMNPSVSSESMAMHGVWTFTKRDIDTGEIVSSNTYTNIVPTVARAALAAQLANSGTYPAKVTYVAVGTDGTAVANGDTVLGTELARKAIAGASAVSNVLTVDGFFNETEANGTLAEAGIFGDGSATQASATTDTGILYSHVLITETKTSSETLTITVTFTFS